MTKKRTRTLYIVLSLALVFSFALNTGITAFAQAGPTAEETVCTHEHGEACGYVEGAECDHDCTDALCGEDGASCVHSCADRTCGYVTAAVCGHEHDEDCGGLVALQAEEEEPDAVTGIITDFVFPDAVQVEIATPESDIAFPVEVTANVQPDSVDAEPTTVTVGVGAWNIWFGAYTPGEESMCIYEADRASLTLPDGVTLPDDAEMPLVRVEVGEFDGGITTTATVTGNGYSFDTDTAALTVSTNEGTTAWRTDVNITGSGGPGVAGVTSITIESGVTAIGDGAFSGCEGLTTTSVAIPNTVISIGANAFTGCKTLTTVTIPDSVETIGASAFVECEVLTGLTIPSGVVSIGNTAFARCYALTTITIPDTVTSLGAYAFEGCTSLESATLGTGITTISNLLFYNCTELTTIVMPAATSIGTNAFSNCTKLTTATVPNGTVTVAASPSTGGNPYLTPTGANTFTVRANGSNFKAWTGDTTGLSSTTSTAPTYTMPANAGSVTLTANFANTSNDFAVTGTEGTDYTYAGNVLTIKNGKTVTITMASGITTAYTDTIVLETGATATINGLTVSASSDESPVTVGGDYANIELLGTNTLQGGESCAGLNVPVGSALTIDGTGTLIATGGDCGAGIGGNDYEAGGAVVIWGGTITATGAGGGAGIGGGDAADGGSVSITDGTVVATGSDSGSGNGAGIGAGGGGSSGGSISVDYSSASAGASVTAIGTPAFGANFTPASIGSYKVGVGGTQTSGNYTYSSSDTYVVLYKDTVSAHVPVTNITDVPTIATAGTDLPLTGTVVPSNATNQTIVWSVKSAGTTGASITGSGSTLSTTAAGMVTVTATIINGATASTNYTKEFTITVNTPAATPSITGHPQAATYGQNDTATTLSVVASVTDGGTLSYQWFSNTTDITTGGTAVGTNSASYTPSTATVGTLYYYVVVTNTKAGAVPNTATATSNTAAIEVTPPAETPTITGQPQGATYTVGDSATPLSVSATVGTGILSYQWYSNTSDSTTGGTIIGGATNATYTPSTATAGTTHYYVVVKNTDGTKIATATSNTAAVVVNAAPAITGQSANPASIVTIGGTSTITVTGTNLPAGVTVTAFDGASPAVPAITGTTNASGNVTLTFPANSSTTDEKVYTIKASLDGGSTWAAPTCTVNVQKHLPTHADPDDDTISKGSGITGSGTAADPYVVTAGKAFSLTVAGDRQGATGMVDGDTKNTPVDWNINPSGTFPVGGPYTINTTLPTAGTYTLTVNYRVDRWDGSAWVDAGTPYSHTFTVKVNAADSGSSSSPADSSTPATTTGSPQTGDNSSMGLWVAMLTVAALGLIVAVVVWRRRKPDDRQDEKAG